MEWNQAWRRTSIPHQDLPSFKGQEEGRCALVESGVHAQEKH